MKLDIARVEFRAELDINNIEFQKRGILLYNLKRRLFNYII